MAPFAGNIGQKSPVGMVGLSGSSTEQHGTNGVVVRRHLRHKKAADQDAIALSNNRNPEAS